MQHYREAQIPAAVIAESLDVQRILDGRGQKAGGQIQVHAQLIDPKTEAHRWAEDYRRELTTDSLFALQSEIARQIAGALQTTLTAGEQQRVDRRPTDDLEAYRLYLRGRRHLARRTFGADQHVQQAVRHFRRALDKDSSFALAWAGLANAAALYPSKLPNAAITSEVNQEAVARRALELAPNLAEARAAMGHVHLRQMNAPAARRELQRAIDLKPSYWGAHYWLGELYLHIGRPEQALEHLQLVVELNPQHARARHWLFDAYNATGQLEKSLREAQRQQQLGLEQDAAIGGEIRALISLGRREEARRLAEERIAKLSVETNWGGLFRAYLVDILAQQGDTARARKYLDELEAADTPPKMRAWAHMRIGQPEKAFDIYQRLEEKDWGNIGVLEGLRLAQREYPSLRDDSRYRKLIRTANRAWGLQPDGSFPKEPGFTSEADG